MNASSAASETVNPERDSTGHKTSQGSLRARAISGSIWVIGGNFASQVVRLASNLILTRLLLEEYFGLMLLVQSVITGLELVSDFGIYGSVINHKRGDQQTFLNTAWTTQVLRGVVLWMVACLLTWPMAQWFGFPELIYLIPVAALTVVFTGFQSIEVALLNRGVMLGRITAMQLSTHALGVIVMVGLALVYQSVWVLVIGSLVSVAARSLASHFLVPGFQARFGWDKECFLEIYRYGRWITVSSALTFIVMYSDRFMIGRILDKDILGVYAIALFLAMSCIDVVRKLSRTTLFPIYARLAEKGRAQLRKQTFKVRGVLLAVMLPGLWITTLFGPWIINLLYDPRYAEAGWMLQFVSLGSIGMVITLTASSVLLAVRDSFRYMILQVARSVLLIGGMLIGYHYGGFPGLLLGVAASRFAEYPVLAWAIRKYHVWLPGLDLSAMVVSATVVGLGWYMGLIG